MKRINWLHSTGKITREYAWELIGLNVRLKEADK
jgi:hypothetical protein